MRTSSAAMALAANLCMALADYSPFVVTSMKSSSPSDKQNQLAAIDFDVKSVTDASYIVHCHADWNDTITTHIGAPPSQFNPANFVYQCDALPWTFEPKSYVSSADFSLFITQTVNYSQIVNPYMTYVDSVVYEFSNDTSAYTCTDDASGTHCSGTNFTIPIADVKPGCEIVSDVNVGFPVNERTVWGDNIFVAGNIPELGDWDPYNAYPAYPDHYTNDYPAWMAGFLLLPAGTTFEYKFIKWAVDGILVWECGDNRVYTVPSDSCGLEYAGGEVPAVFRCGVSDPNAPNATAV